MVGCEHPRYFWECTLGQKMFQSSNHCCSLWGYRAGRASFPRYPAGWKKPLVFLAIKNRTRTSLTARYQEHKAFFKWLERLREGNWQDFIFLWGSFSSLSSVAVLSSRSRKTSGAQVTVAEASQGREAAWGPVQSCSHIGIKLFSCGPVTNYIHLGSEPLLIWAQLYYYFECIGSI